MTSTEPRTQHWPPGEVAGVARGGLANLAGAVIAGVAGLGVAWLVARGLGPAAAGVFFTSVAGFTLVAGVAKLGTPTGLVYWIARLRAQGRPDLAAACVPAGLTPVVAVSIGLALALWLAAPWLAPAIGGSPEQVDAAVTGARVLAAFLPLAALTDAALAATRGYHLMRPTVVLERLLRPVLQLTSLAAVAAASLWMAVPAAAWPLAWAWAYLPVLLLAGYSLHRVQPALLPTAPVGAAFWRFTGPRAVASVLQLALQRLDIVLVAVIAGPATAAVYAVAGRFLLLGQLANQAVGQAVQPRLAHRLGAADLPGAAALYRTATAWLVLLTWPLCLLVAGYAPLYLGLFGEAYRAGAPVVAVLAAAMLLATGCGAVDMVLAMAGRTTWNLANVMVALAVMVVLDVALIPRLGAMGAAVGLAAAIAVNNLLPLAQIGYVLRIHPFGAGTLTAAVLAGSCFGILPAVVHATAGTGPVPALATLTASLGLYAAGLRRFRHRLSLDALAGALSRTSPHRNGESHAH